ncbi:right-handed parallel beta-helix repeat-containing protein [Verrucomicrobiota bacterium]
MFRITSLTVIFLMVMAGAAAAGDYLEPPGPPGSERSRMRTLNEIEPATPIHELPYVITNSGKYVIVGNLTGTNGHNGITIQADNVTVNLNGFMLKGVSGSLRGISVPSSQTSITIMNGAIRDWGQGGIYAELAENSKYTGITTISNGWATSKSGISVGKNSEVSDCTSAKNKSMGIWVRDSSVVRNCKTYSNTSRGIYAYNGSTVIGCSSYANTSDGISAFHGSTVTRCTAYDNFFRGISVMDGCTITDSTAYGNTNMGFSVGAGVTITRCSASRNGSDGIYGGGGCIISGCSAYRNSGDGIRVSYDTYVTGNSCSSNGGIGNGAGIRVTSTRNRIQENHVASNEIGIDVDGADNIIIRNTASANTTADYDITSGNQTGTIRTTILGAGTWDNFSL